MKMEKNKERVCSFLNITIHGNQNAYKETAHIVLILSRDEILEREKFTVPFYSITLVLGAKSLSTARVDMSYLSFCFLFPVYKILKNQTKMIENDCPSQNNASRAFFKCKQTFFLTSLGIFYNSDAR